MERFAILWSVTLACAFGQNPGDPFTLIRLIQRPSGPTVDPGVIEMHRAARVPVDVIGLKSITGTQQVWLIEAQGSFGSIEATEKALATAPATPDPGAALAPATLVGLLRPALSYRPEDALKALPAARYFQVTLFRTRPGTSMDFAEVIRTRNAALDQVNLDRPELGYQVISGGESGTYVFLAPLLSLQSIDEAIARMWGHPDTPSHTARRATNRITTDADITREQLIFRVEPKISYVSDAFAAASPDFWNGKP